MVYTYDDLYISLTKDVLENGTWVKDNVRTKYADGKPAYYKQLLGVAFCITPEMGVPILRSKFVGQKHSLIELDWIWRTRSNDVKWLTDRNVHIWDNWVISERVNHLVYVKPVEYTGKHNGNSLLRPIKVKALVDTDAELRTSNQCGDYYILDRDWDTERVLVQFKDTGYIKETSTSQVYNGKIRDPYQRTVEGIGFYGNFRKQSLLDALDVYHKRWVKTWENMIRRCSPKNKEHKMWAEYLDTYVGEEFQSCELFLQWVVDNKPMDQKLLGILQLDKDYFNSKVYSPETCTLLTPTENTGLTNLTWYVYMGSVFTSKPELAKEISKQTGILLTKTNKIPKLLEDCITSLTNNGEVKEVNSQCTIDGELPRFSLDWVNTIGRAYGYQLENSKRTLTDAKGNRYKVNQVDYVLHELKHNPNSRRIVTSLLDIEDTAYMALEPCVWSTTWSVEEDTVHLQVKQRSSDLALGNPYNVYQYYVLLHLIAHFTGLKPGNLYWYVDNMHIYDRHIDMLKEQIANYEKDPNKDILTLSMANIEGETFDTYDFSNITVLGYTHKGKYSYEVAE